MKHLSILLGVGVWLFVALPTHAAVTTNYFLCGGDKISAQFDLAANDTTKKTATINACFTYLRGRPSTGSQRLQVIQTDNAGAIIGGGYTYSAGFCWCRKRSITDPITTTVAYSENECNTSCAPLGHTNYDTTYIQRDNYCWCQEYTSVTATTCRNHRSQPNSNGYGPINTQPECNAFCPTLRYNGDATKAGTAKHFDRNYNRAYENTTDCSAPAGSGGTGGSSGSGSGSGGSGGSGGTASVMPPVRLFNPLAGASTVVDIINRVIKMMLGLVGAGALAAFIYGGIQWMIAGGDSKKVSDAQTIIKNATLGLLLIMFSYSIVATFFSILR